MIKAKRDRELEDEKIAKFFSDTDKVTAAIQAGIRAALLRHKKLGNPICEWRDGKVVWVPPEEISA